MFGARLIPFKVIVVATIFLGVLAISPLAFAAEGVEEAQTLEPLAWQTDLAVWTAVVFILVLVVLWIFAFGPIVKALDQRERSELDRLAAAEKNNADAKALLEQYRQKLSDSEDEVRKILGNAKSEAERQASALVDEAKRAASEERVRALKEIQNASDIALQEIAEKSAALATKLAGKIIGEEVDPAKHARLIETAVSEVVKR